MTLWIPINRRWNQSFVPPFLTRNWYGMNKRSKNERWRRCNCWFQHRILQHHVCALLVLAAKPKNYIKWTRKYMITYVVSSPIARFSYSPFDSSPQFFHSTSTTSLAPPPLLISFSTSFGWVTRTSILNRVRTNYHGCN